MPQRTQVVDDERLTAEFSSRFGSSPQAICKASGRANLLGEHIDYNDGFVLPFAIDRYTSVAFAKSTSGYSTIVNLDEGNEIELGSGKPYADIPWANYVGGVVTEFESLTNSHQPFNAVFTSDVPIGAGLSSSASLEMAFATVCQDVFETEYSAIELALHCQRVENEKVGVPCGIMDQFSCALGKKGQLIFLDCRSSSFEMIEFANRSIEFLLINSNVKHALSDGEYATRRMECDSALEKTKVASWRALNDLGKESAKEFGWTESEAARARHVVSETKRARSARELIERGDWSAIGNLMQQSHESLRDDFQVSCRELDLLVDLARDALAPNEGYGSRMMGGGFGGCTINLVAAGYGETVGARVAEAYRVKTGIEANFLVVQPADGLVKTST